LTEAVAHFRRAVEIKPELVPARVNLGAVLRLQHRFDEATTELGLALRLEPGNAVAHTNLGGILAAQHKPREAIAEFRLALQANPDLLEPLTSLGWILATSPDAAIRQPAEASHLAGHADDLTNHQDARVLDTLAAAYAAEGRFAQAIATEQRALELAETAGVRDATDQLRLRLELYRRNRPFREPMRAEAESKP
jgi:spermidine synthase